MCAITISVAALSCIAADHPATAPADAADRNFDTVMNEFQTASAPLRELITTKTLTDPAARAQVSPKAIAAIKKTNALGRELAHTNEQGKVIAAQIDGQNISYLLIFGDPETLATVKAQAAGTDPRLVADAKRNLLFSDWAQSAADPAAQAKIVDSADRLAKADAKSFKLAQVLMMMSDMGIGDDAVHDRLVAIAASMDTEMTTEIKQAQASEKKLRELEGKPLELKGATVDGKPFTTADWKGKVILVDFWATWCPQCLEEIPRIKTVYTQYHGKGLEVLGISNDSDKNALTAYLGKDAAMRWPQLFDPKTKEMDLSPLSTTLGIETLPVMLLIDKNGVCISARAGTDFETKIPKLLGD